jgi:hypothetical protein
MGYEQDSSGSGRRLVAGSCEHGIASSDSMKFWEISELLSNCWLQERTQLHRLSYTVSGSAIKCQQRMGNINSLSLAVNLAGHLDIQWQGSHVFPVSQ